MLWAGRNLQGSIPEVTAAPAAQHSLSINSISKTGVTGQCIDSDARQTPTKNTRDRTHTASTPRVKSIQNLSSSTGVAPKPSTRSNNASRISGNSRRILRSVLERKHRRQNKIIRGPDRPTSLLPGTTNKPTQVNPKNKHSQRKLILRSKILDSEKYKFRFDKRARASRLPVSTLRSPGLAKMHHSSGHFKSHRSEKFPRRSDSFIVDDDDEDDSEDEFVPDDDSPDEPVREISKAISTPDHVSVRFNEVDAAKLLPSPSFPELEWVKAKLWSDEDEAALQRQHGPWANTLATWAANQNSELALWKGMIQLYGRTPFDLFRYGLKIDARPLRFISMGTGLCININMTQDLALELSILLSHPIWHNDIALLRFALQYAVYCRIEEHIYPLPAVLDAMANDLQDEFLRNIVEMQYNGESPEKQRVQVVGDYYYHSLEHGGPHANHDLKELFAELKNRVKSRPALNEQEKMLFLLRLCDVKAIKEALNSLELYGVKKWESVDTYHQRRMEGLHKKTRAFPPSSNTMHKWKKACFLHELREKMIRHKMRLAGFPDNLLDYPEADPIPFYLFSKHATKGQRAIISGVVYSVDEEQLPPPRGEPDPAAP